MVLMSVVDVESYSDECGDGDVRAILSVELM